MGWHVACVGGGGGGRYMHLTITMGKLQASSNLEDLGVDVEDNIKLIFVNRVGGSGPNVFGSG